MRCWWHRDDREYARYRLVARLIAAVAVTHVLVLIVVLFYQGRLAQSAFHINIRTLRGQVPVVLAPLCKRVPAAQALLNRTICAPRAPAMQLKKPVPKKSIVQAQKSKIKPVKQAAPGVREQVQKTLEKTTQEQPVQPVVVGHKDLEELAAQALVHDELVRHWQPVPGVPVGTTCVLCFVIDAQGRATDITIEQSSGIRACDSSARMALSASVFDMRLARKKHRVTLHV